ncbi:MAG: Ig-like domain-containing protein, partial [Thermoplasmata archaeon]|nr:Ig-like domain-containing protein [Thermoplasmata archaeon]
SIRDTTENIFTAENTYENQSLIVKYVEAYTSSFDLIDIAFVNQYVYVDYFNPIIVLDSPMNNSLIRGGSIIALNVTDVFLDRVYYSVNGGLNQTLDSPFDIDTTGWESNVYTIEVHAIDKANNSATETYVFDVDANAPIIILNSPVNNSVILPGTILDFDVQDEHLNLVNYSINGEPPQEFVELYNINTSIWRDGIYSVEIRTNDTVGNINISTFNFIVDSVKPVILLNSPDNNSVITPGTLIDIEIVDENIHEVYCKINDSENQILNAPYHLNTTGWSDDIFTLKIHAIDGAGNEAIQTYEITIDSIKPVIILTSPINNSVILPGAIIDFEITDTHLVYIEYSVNNDINRTLHFPYKIDTNKWTSGTYIIEIYAQDMATNITIETYIFEVDKTAPEIISTVPLSNTVNVPVNTTVVIEFSEQMNRSSVERSISMIPNVNISSFKWNDNETIVTIDIESNLTQNTTYVVIVETTAKDAIGNSLILSYSWSFTTYLDTDNDGIPDINDLDDDGDDVPDEQDAFPYNPSEWIDTDGDGIGNNADEDDDNDRMPDTFENQYGFDPLNASDATEDFDGDGYTNLEEYIFNTNPVDSNSKPDFGEDKPEETVNVSLLVVLIVVIIILIGALIQSKRKQKSVSQKNVK